MPPLDGLPFTTKYFAQASQLCLFSPAPLCFATVLLLGSWRSKMTRWQCPTHLLTCDPSTTGTYRCWAQIDPRHSHLCRRCVQGKPFASTTEG